MRHILIVLILLLGYSVSFAQSDDFAEASVDIETPYIGQPLTYTIRVFTTRDIQNTSVIEPRFNGFGRASYVGETVVASESRNGIAYNVIEQSLLLYPLRVGQQVIDPLRIEIPETPFDPALSVQTQALTIDVQPLPDGAPTSFKNAVGQFDVEADVDTRNVTTGSAITLSVTINGTGNIEQIIAPDVGFPATWRVFPQQPITDQNTLRFATKTFQWILLPDVAGAAEIASIAFSFFNPQSQTYETRQTLPIPLTITASDIVAAEQAIVQQTTLEQSREPLPLKANTQAFLPPNPALMFWLLWLIPPLVVLILWIPRRKIIRPRRERPRQVRKSNALQRTRDQLQVAQSAEPRLAYQQIRTAIFDYLSIKAGIHITEDDLENKLSHLPRKLQHLLLQCLEEAASGQYAPVSKDDVATLMRQTMKILNAVEKAWQ